MSVPGLLTWLERLWRRLWWVPVAPCQDGPVHPDDDADLDDTMPDRDEGRAVPDLDDDRDDEGTRLDPVMDDEPNPPDLVERRWGPDPADQLSRDGRERLAALTAVSRVLVGDDYSTADLVDAAAYVVRGERVPPPPPHVYRMAREAAGGY